MLRKMLLNINRHALFGFFLATTIPVTFLAWVHISIFDYPFTDGAAYLNEANAFLQVFEEHGFLRGMQEVFEKPRWKPTLMAPLIVPSLALFGGQSLVATSVLQILLYFFTGIFCFFILRRYLNVSLSVLGTVYFLSLPWMLNSSLHLLPELPFMCLFFASVYFLLGNENFKNNSQSVASGLLLGIALCLRPGVGTLQILPPVFWILYNQYKKHSMTLADGLKVVSIPIYCILLVLLSVLIQRNFSSLEVFAGVVILFLLFFTCRKKLDLNAKNIQSYFFAASALPTLFFSSHLFYLYRYIYICSFSPVAKRTGGRSDISGAEQFWSVVQSNFGPSLILFLGIGIYLLVKKSDSNQIQTKKVDTKWLLKYSFLCISLLVVIGGVSFSSEVRYYHASFGLLILSLYAYFAKSIVNQKLFMSSFALITLLHLGITTQKLTQTSTVSFLNNLSQTEFFSLSSAAKLSEAGQSLPLPVNLFEHFNNRTAHNRKKVAVLPLKGPIDYRDAWRLETLARERDLPVQFAYPHRATAKDTFNEQIRLLKQEFDYVWVGPIGSSVDFVWFSPHSILAGQYLDFMSTNQNHVKSKKIFSLKDRSGKNLNYWLVEI